MNKIETLNSLPSSAAKRVQEVQTLQQQMPQVGQHLAVLTRQVKYLSANQPKPWPEWALWSILGLLALIVVLLLALLLKSQPTSLICQPSRINGKTYTVCQPWQ